MTKSDYRQRIVKINFNIKIKMKIDKQSRKTISKKSHDMIKNSTEEIAALYTAVKGHRKQ